MKLYTDIVKDERSDSPIEGAEVFVYEEDGALATLYAADGATTLPNPLTTSNLGVYSFYKPEGEYTGDVYVGARLRYRSRLFVGGGYSGAAQAAAAAAAASAGSPAFASTAAGLAGTSIGAMFWIDNGDGTGTSYRHDAGPVATEIGKFVKDQTAPGAAPLLAGGVPTSSDLASTDTGKGTALLAWKRTGTGAATLTSKDALDELAFNPRQFGAVGDGVLADDTAPMNNMYAAARLVGGRVEITKGTYRVTGNLFVNNGVKRITGKGGVIKFDQASGQISLILGLLGGTVPVSDCVVEDLIIDANGKPTLGIYCQSTVRCTIKGNHIYGLTANTTNARGIFLKSFFSAGVTATGNVIENNRIDGETNPANHADPQIGITLTGDWEFPYPTNGYASTEEEWKANFSLVEPSVWAEGNIVRGNIINGGRYGIMTAGARNNLIEGNSLSHNTRGVVGEIHSHNNSVLRNKIDEFSACAIIFAWSSQDNLIAGNKGMSSVASSDSEGVLTCYVDAKRNRFDGNEFTVTSVDGCAYMLYAGVHVSGCSFTNNRMNGSVQNAYAAVESAWNTAFANAAHRANGESTALNDCANEATADVTFKGNEIIATSAKPYFFLAQVSGVGAYGLSGVTVSGNRMRGSGSRIIEVAEMTASNSANHIFQANDHNASSISAFLTARGLAHFTVFDDPKLSYTATYDPGSIASAASVTTTVAVSGAALGDFVSASFSLSLQGLTLTAHVSNASTVTVVLFNPTGGAIDLASGTLRVRVRKQ